MMIQARLYGSIQIRSWVMNQHEKALLLVRRAERYFYKYLPTYDKAYIDRFFAATKKFEEVNRTILSLDFLESQRYLHQWNEY